MTNHDSPNLTGAIPRVRSAAGKPCDKQLVIVRFSRAPRVLGAGLARGGAPRREALALTLTLTLTLALALALALALTLTLTPHRAIFPP